MSNDSKTETEDFTKVDTALGDILENEPQCDSDGAAQNPKASRPSSAGSVGSGGGGSKGKRRTWKKPKDKPKRPLSAYNLFFKHTRSRIVEGETSDPTAEETIRSIENILSTSRETRRHRKTHGRISFGDLARKIAEKWKAIGAEQKAVFEHYAELDMRRYRKEVKIWKDKKEAEAYAKQGAMDGSMGSMSNSFSSVDSESQYGVDQFTTSINSDDGWGPRRNFYDSMNSSFSSACSVESELSLEPIPIGDMLRNARPNMHASMPNLNIEVGIPGYVDGGDSSLQLLGNRANPPMPQFGQQSLSSMQFNSNQGIQIDDVGPPLVISSGSPGPMELQQLREQNTIQQQQLQRQQQILLRQQHLLQQQVQQSRMAGNNIMPQNQYSDPFASNQNQNALGDGSELENYLSHMDLSNM